MSCLLRGGVGAHIFRHNRAFPFVQDTGASTTHGKPASSMCLMYSTDTREQISWEEPVHISLETICLVTECISVLNFFNTWYIQSNWKSQQNTIFNNFVQIHGVSVLKTTG